MKRAQLKRRLSQMSGYFFFGVMTLVFANVTSSFIVGVFHAGALLYRSEPSPQILRFLDDVIQFAWAAAPTTHRTLVFICATILRYRTKSPSLLNFFVFVAGAWLAVLPFTLMPDVPEEHPPLAQVGRFIITSIPMLAGVFLGAQLRRRSERNAQRKWTIREAKSPQELVQALQGKRLKVALYRLTAPSSSELTLIASSGSEQEFPQRVQLREEISWSSSESSQCQLLRNSFPANDPSMCWCTVLHPEDDSCALLVFVPRSRPLVARHSEHYQELAEHAQLSLRQQELVRHAQLSAREGERRRVSYEIHDRLAQDLISGLLQLDTARSHLGVMKASVEQALATVEETLRRALDEARNLAWKFHDTSLTSPVLIHAMQAEIDEFARKHDIRSQFLAVGDEHRENARNDVVLLAALREALSNIAKHAHAQQVHVTLSNIDGMSVLDVYDDGLGSYQSPLLSLIGPGSFGLTALRQRVESAGGQLLVADAPHGGTCFSVQFPAAAEAAS